MARTLRCVLIVLAMGGVLAVIAHAQIEIPGYEVSDLQLISRESRSDWTNEWTGPIQAATILAWFADHGYPALIRDFNEDGVVDEWDTIELADRLGSMAMATETERGTTDVQLVLGLADYVSGIYPDTFILKIYDPSFPQELQTEQGRTFDPALVDGIELALEIEPNLADYQSELLQGEGLIVGLEESPDANNTYLCGRSFLYEQTPEGYTPVDLTWSDEDRWAEGHQGKVLETVGRTGAAFEIEYRGDWTAVECMIALSPLEELPATSVRTPCADDAIAYDLTVTALGSEGSIQIEECVTPDGDIDTYEYTVTNINYLHNGCGLCLFGVPKPVTLGAIAHDQPGCWLYSEYPSAWVWRLALGSCGILPGESAVFSVSVPGPTVDVAVIGGVAGCPTIDASGAVRSARSYAVETTGPAEPEEPCPDLTVRFLDHACVCDPIDGTCMLTVWADVVNIGTGPVVDAFDVVLRSDDHTGNGYLTYTPPPPLTPGDVWTVELHFFFDMGGELCPSSYEIYVDPPFVPGGFVQECDEDNNNYIGSIDCFCDETWACCLPDGSCAELSEVACLQQGGVFHDGVSCAVVQCPPPVESCGDLIVKITQAYCQNVGAAAPQYRLHVEAEVTNIGTAPVSDAIWVELETPCGDDTDIIHTDLDPGDSATVEFEINCGISGGCHDVVVIVDGYNFVTECDDGNNEDEATICCRQ
ncbi:hypothetical protein KKG90_08920 [Candidatus Bipolaricaulota bacterium]|nr:hypothetical protein [Candidatus Bipolaricaulota bacterium]